MNILGLDLSMTASGICFSDGETLTVKTDAKQGDARLAVIRAAVLTAIESQSPDMAVLEEAPPGLKGPAIKAVHMVQGAVRAALIEYRIPYAVVNPSTLKVYATGKKGATKTDMAMTAFKRAGWEFGDDNQCDAWWLQVMAMDHYGQPLFDLPIAQRAHLAAVAWPVIQAPAVLGSREK